MQSGRPYSFTYGDYLAIREEAKFVGAISPVLEREDIRAVSDYGSTNGQVSGRGPTPTTRFAMYPLAPDAGSTIRTIKDRRRVAVVGWELLKNVFPGRPALGEPMLLNGIEFQYHRHRRKSRT